MPFNDSNATTDADHSVVADIQNSTFDHEIIVVGTTETFMSVNGSTNMTERKELLIENKGNKAVWVGATGITDDAGIKEGIKLDVTESVTLNFGPNMNVYAITKTGTTNVMVWESA
jgi:hypothetical protein